MRTIPFRSRTLVATTVVLLSAWMGAMAAESMAFQTQTRARALAKGDTDERCAEGRTGQRDAHHPLSQRHPGILSGSSWPQARPGRAEGGIQRPADFVKTFAPID